MVVPLSSPHASHRSHVRWLLLCIPLCTNVHGRTNSVLKLHGQSCELLLNFEGKLGSIGSHKLLGAVTVMHSLQLMMLLVVLGPHTAVKSS